MDSVKKARIAYIIYSAVIMVLGILLMIFPEISSTTITYIVGSIIVLCGLVKLILYFVNDSYGLAFQFDFALGIFTMLIGTILLLHPKNTLAFLNVVIGVFVMIDGALKLQTSKEARSFGIKNWLAILVLSILTLCVGLIMVLEPFEGAIALTAILGIALFADGIENLLVALYTIKLVKRIGSVNKQL